MRKFGLSIPFQRLIGFTVPRDDIFYICDHNEVWKITVGDSASVEFTDFEPYAFVEGRDDFVGWGREDAPAILENEICKVSFDFDAQRDSVEVFCRHGSATESIKFNILSGDWFCASLSVEGNLLAIAEPDGIELYEIGSKN